MDKSFNFFENKVETTTKKAQGAWHTDVKQIIEALLFSTSEPLALSKMKEVVNTAYPVKTPLLKELIASLNQEYQTQKRTFSIVEVAEGYLLRTVPKMAPYLAQLHQDRRGEKLSNAAKEILAIIAYKQPITRAEIEALRGVDSSGTVTSLQERGLIEITGRRNTPGRPALWGITKRFLTHFGLKNRDHLTKVLNP